MRGLPRRHLCSPQVMPLRHSTCAGGATTSALLPRTVQQSVKVHITSDRRGVARGKAGRFTPALIFAIWILNSREDQHRSQEPPALAGYSLRCPATVFIPDLLRRRRGEVSRCHRTIWHSLESARATQAGAWSRALPSERNWSTADSSCPLGAGLPAHHGALVAQRGLPPC